MKTKHFIYKYTFPNNKVYIGQSNTNAFRYNKRSAYKGQVVYNAMMHYKKWNSEILEYCSKEEVDDKEIYYIELYKANAKSYGYNRTAGGCGNHNPNEETRKKMSERKKQYYATGGKPNIPTFTDEQKKAQSERAKVQVNRDIRGFISGQNKIEIDVYKNEEYIGRFVSIREACRQLNLGNAWKHSGDLWSGRRKHIKGYKIVRIKSTREQ